MILVLRTSGVLGKAFVSWALFFLVATHHAHSMESLWRVWEPCPAAFAEFGQRFEEFNGKIQDYFDQKSPAEISDIFESDPEEGDALRLFAPYFVEPMTMAIFELNCWADYNRFMQSSVFGQRDEAVEHHRWWSSCLRDSFRDGPLPKGFELISACYMTLHPEGPTRGTHRLDTR